MVATHWTERLQWEPAATALQMAASTFTRAATDPAIGIIENRWPTMTKNGLPGGCGSPNV